MSLLTDEHVETIRQVGYCPSDVVALLSDRTELLRRIKVSRQALVKISDSVDGDFVTDTIAEEALAELRKP